MNKTLTVRFLLKDAHLTTEDLVGYIINHKGYGVEVFQGDGEDIPTLVVSTGQYIQKEPLKEAVTKKRTFEGLSRWELSEAIFKKLSNREESEILIQYDLGDASYSLAFKDLKSGSCFALVTWGNWETMVNSFLVHRISEFFPGPQAVGLAIREADMYAYSGELNK